jgi:molecular chaperone HtpG
MKETMQFQTETKKLLDMMIHSIYTHKEIFLRELISNASDAIDKLKFNPITDTHILGDDTEFKIEIVTDKDARTITIKDNGIGMTKEEVVTNIGTIAKSGSKDFMEKLKEAKENKEMEIIGQFGVGFYSSFMVADKVSLVTKSPYDEKGVRWESTGEGEYIIEDVDKSTRGTEITLHLRKDEDENTFSEYLETWEIKNLVKKYSDYVRYPIEMDIKKENPKKNDKGEIIEGEYEIEIVRETLNSMTPIWKKSKEELKDEDYNEFYKGKFHDWMDPLKTIHYKVEGNIEYTALLFIPGKAPMNFHTKDYEKGLQLYTKNVFIMDKCKDLIPDYFRFVKGLVDSSDFSLNISREILQQNKQLQVIAKNIEKKIKKELETMMKNEREKYEEFFDSFGTDIKFGVYDGFGAKKDLLKDLLIFESSFSDKKTSLKEYVERMKEDQKYIYFVSGDDKEKLKKLPQMESVRDKGYEVLFFLDKIDEFAIQAMREFEGKEFKAINQGNLDSEASDDDKKLLEEISKKNEGLISRLKDVLKEKVADVRLTSRLKSSAVCLVSGEGVSFEMEKVMSQMPGENPFGPVKADRILELNPDHDLFKTLNKVFEKDADSLSDIADLLYSQALLIEGFQLEDPVDFSNKMTNLMIKANS